MISTFTCHHCGKTLPCNPRIKQGQKFCGAKDCRRASRRAWKKKQYNTNRTYRKKNLESQRAWRKQRPSHQYQHEYRNTHPGYVDRNRELQKKRNKKRKKDSVPMIVNGNTLSLQPSVVEAYALIQVKKGKDCKWEHVHGQNVVIIEDKSDFYLKS